MNIKNKEKNKKEMRIIGQGTYGCVYSPNISCSTPYTLGSSNFLSKIQKVDATSENELKIGKMVRDIDGFSERFAPILSSCPVKLGKMNKEEFTTCKMIVNEKNKQAITQSNLVSNKLLNVGKDTFGEKMDSLLHTGTKQKYIKKLCETHLYLLDSVSKLNDADVIHMDIKHNNIMYDDNRGLPIIIDFGLSSDAKKVTTTNEPFGITAPYYGPWCIEIILLSHISKYVHTAKDGAKEALVKPIENLDNFKQFFKKNLQKNELVHSNLFTQEERGTYVEKQMKWIDTFKGKTWKAVWTQLASTYKSWDAYGLTMMYLNELSIAGMLDTNNIGFLKQYIEVLKKNLTEIPSERKTANELRTILHTIFTKANKKEYKTIMHQIEAVYKNAENKQKMRKAREDSVLATLVEEKQMYKQLNK